MHAREPDRDEGGVLHTVAQLAVRIPVCCCFGSGGPPHHIRIVVNDHTGWSALLRFV
jgi:hypothetical protein